MVFLRFPDLKAKKGIPWSKMHLDRKEKAGEFPKRVKLSANSVAWIEAEVDEWAQQRIAESRQSI
jgi:prophage regulatory protein